MDTPRFAVVHVAVLEGAAAAIYVARRDVSTLFVGGPDFTNDDLSCFRRVPLSAALERDPALSELANLPVGCSATRSDASDTWSRGTIPVGETFLVTYEARPDEANPDRHEVGGAFVNCWVVTDSLESALRNSADHLSESGWVIIERTNAELVTAADYAEDPYFRRVQIDGLIAVFHTFPREELSVN